MKKNIFNVRSLALILALMMVILSFSLVGCDKNKDNNDIDSTAADSTAADTTADSSSGDGESDETTGGSDDPWYVGAGAEVFANGKCDYDIVIAQKASSTVTAAATKLKNAFKDTLKVTVDMRKDAMFKTLNGGTMDGPKIVIGAIDDEYSKKEQAVMYDSEYSITVKDSAVYILGGTDETIALAVDKFIEMFVKAGTTTISLEAGEIHSVKSNPKIQNLRIAGNPIINYTIAYYDSVYAKLCAQRIQAVLSEKLDVTLELVPEKESNDKCEILVGKTSDTESKALRGAYDRPNVYYDIAVSGDKLVVMGEGYKTLDKVASTFELWIDTVANDTDLSGSVVHGDILADVDATDAMTDALEKKDSVDMRVLHWNMAAPLSWDQSETAWGKNWPFPTNETGRRMRGEMQADVVLIYNPDIITTNEIYDYHAGGVQFRAFKNEVSEYFTEINNSQYDTRDDDMPLNVPTAPGTANAENPEKIFIRKGKFSVIDSGWRYLSDGTTFHGIHWAILETEGKQFIISGAHYSSATTEVTYASEHQSAIRFAQKVSGSSTALPVILTGDMFTYINHSNGRNGAGYYYHENNGYKDAQTQAAFNCNEDKGTKHGTFHDPMNDTNKGRASEDFVWYKNGLVASKIGVLTTPESTNTSDHWPVFADLSFVN